MILVIRDVEGDDFLLLPLLVLHKGEDEAAVDGIIIGLDFLPAPVDKRLLLHLAAGGHGKEDAVAHFIVGGVVGTGLRQDAQHVEDAAGVAILHLLRVARGVVPGAALLHVRQAVTVRKPRLVHRVALAFLGSFPEVEGFQLVADVAGQRIAHLEEEVGLLAAHGEQIEAVGRLLMIGGFIDGEACQSHFLPDKLPVEIQVVHDVLARLEGQVLRRALRPSSSGGAQCDNPRQEAENERAFPLSNYVPGRCCDCRRYCCSYCSSFSCLHLAFVF